MTSRLLFSKEQRYFILRIRGW